MSAVRDVEWESCLLEPAEDSRELEGYAQRELGMVPPSMRYLGACPWVARSMVGIHPYHELLAHVDFRIADLIGLVVSQDNSCRFCYAAQRALLRMQGFPERRIRQLEEDLFGAELEPRERAALEFARRLSRGSPLVASRELAQLREAGYGEVEARELAFVAASHVYFNRVCTLPAIPPERIEALPDRLWARILAPLMRPLLRSRMRRGRPAPLAPEERTGPYAYLVLALEGLPAAHALRRLLDEAFASPILSETAKTLIFAVVARGLGCSISEAEATRLLREQGLSAEEVAETLAHLASSRLGPAEAPLLALARETIRYRPAQIQRRGRGVLDVVGAERFVEFIGLSALAHAVCRLGAVAART